MTKSSKTSAAQKRRTLRDEAAARQARQRRLIVAVGIGAVLVVAAVIAVALSTAPSAIEEPATQPVVISGTPLPEYDSETNDDPAVGMTLPSLTGIGLDGQSLTIGPDGRAKAIVIFAHWCPHCQREIPTLADWLSTNPLPDGVDVVGLSTAISDTRSNYPPSTWLSSIGWRQPTITDDADSSAYAALGGSAFPGWVFVTADGRVAARVTGELEMSVVADYLEQIAP